MPLLLVSYDIINSATPSNIHQYCSLHIFQPLVCVLPRPQTFLCTYVYSEQWKQWSLLILCCRSRRVPATSNPWSRPDPPSGRGLSFRTKTLFKVVKEICERPLFRSPMCNRHGSLLRVQYIACHCSAQRGRFSNKYCRDRKLPVCLTRSLCYYIYLVLPRFRVYPVSFFFSGKFVDYF